MTHCPSLTARLPASLLVAALACGGLWSAAQAQGEAAPRAHVTKNGVDVDLRSLGRQVADALAESGTLVGFGEVSPDPGETVVPQVQLRSEEHTSELQSRLHLVCRLLLEKKKQ